MLVFVQMAVVKEKNHDEAALHDAVYMYLYERRLENDDCRRVSGDISKSLAISLNKRGARGATIWFA